jgi:predicted nucleotidyltransferase
MRLSTEEIRCIKRIIVEEFGSDALLWLFGSRIDDAKRGGDVDLYVAPVLQDDLFKKRVICPGKLEAALPYPVDLVVQQPERDLPVCRIAREQGVRL